MNSKHKEDEEGQLRLEEMSLVLECAILIEDALLEDHLLFLHQGIAYWASFEAKIQNVLNLAQKTKNLAYKEEYLAVQNSTMAMVRFNKKFLEDIVALRQ